MLLSSLALAVQAQEAQEADEAPVSEGSEGLAEPLVVSEEEAEQLAWENTDPQREGAAVISLSGELVVTDPQAASAQGRKVGGAFNLAIVGRARKWPLLLGMGIGVTYLEYSSTPGPEQGLIFRTETTLSRSLELRHADLILRVQPWWARVRPYVEGAFGLAGLWGTSEWSASDGTTLDKAESQKSISYLTGVSAGLDIALLTLSEDAVGASQLLLSVGVRRMYTGPMTWTSVVLSEGSNEARLLSVRERLRTWQPFVSLSVSFATKPRPATAPWSGAAP